MSWIRLLSPLASLGVFCAWASPGLSQNIQPDFHATGRVVVAARGGDFNSIHEALAAIKPSREHPFIIDVLPGTYVESVRLKSFVHLRGAGPDLVRLVAPTSDPNTLILEEVKRVIISGLTIIARSDAYGLVCARSSDIHIDDNSFTGGFGGMTIFESSAVSITDNIIPSLRVAVNLQNNSQTIASRNVATNNEFIGIFLNEDSTTTVSDNIITGNEVGIEVAAGAPGTDPLITHNRITGSSQVDLVVDADARPNISFNVYDSLTGAGGSGLYNVNSAGNAAPEP